MGLDLKKILSGHNLYWFLFVFFFIQIVIKDINKLVFIVVAIACIYYYNIGGFSKSNSNNMTNRNNRNNSINKKKKLSNFRDHNKFELKTDIDSLLKLIKKYDNNNLLYLVKKNIKNLYRHINKKDRVYMKNDIDTILFLKKKVLNYINSLNIQYDDTTIDYVVVGVKDILDMDIAKFKEGMGNNMYNYFIDKIEGYSKDF